MKVTLGSYGRFIFYHQANYALFPLAVVLFAGYQLAVSAILISYSKYEEMQESEAFWLTLGILHVAAVLLIFLKSFLMELVVLLSNEKIHSDMVMGMVRSPLSYFDVTPSGQITNKFSNDLGVMDGQLAQTFTYVIEKFMLWAVMFGAIFSMNAIYAVPAVACLFFFTVLYNYCKLPIIASKQLTLKLKSSVFSQLREMMRGLVPIQAFGQTPNFVGKFIGVVNADLQSNVCFLSVERAFAVLGSYGTVLILVIGMELGAATIREHILFGVQVLFIHRMILIIQYFLRQLITIEGLMICEERALTMVDLPSEKELFAEGDEHLQWAEAPSLQLKGLSLRYRPELPLVLHDICFSIGPK